MITCLAQDGRPAARAGVHAGPRVPAAAAVHPARVGYQAAAAGRHPAAASHHPGNVLQVLQTIHRSHNQFSQSRRRPLLATWDADTIIRDGQLEESMLTNLDE